MDNCSNFISLCNPCSTKYHALQDFQALNVKKKVFVSAVTGIVALLTLPIFGLFAVLTFRCMVKKFSAAKLNKKNGVHVKFHVQKVQKQAIKHLPQQKLEEKLRKIGASPLICAIVRNDLKKVEELIHEGNDVHMTDAKGLLPLHWAAKEGHLEAVKLLITKTHVDAQDVRMGNTALIWAASYNEKDVVEFLLAQNANPNISNNWDELPIESAAKEGHLEIVKLFLGTASEYVKSCTLGWASFYGHLNVVKFLLEENVDVNIPKRSRRNEDGVLPFHEAVEGRNLEIIKLLFAKTNNIYTKDEFGRTALGHAASIGHPEIVEFLLEKDFNPNIPDADGKLPLHHTVNWYFHRFPLKLLELLISRTNDINTTDEDGTTPLNRAAERSDDENSSLFVDLLLQHQADANIPDRFDNLPLHWAAQNKHLKVIQLLAPKTNDINAQGYKRSTALSFAAGEGATEIVKFLLGVNADPNIPDDNGNLPLHWAARKGHLDIVKLLIPKTHDIDAKGERGKTAIGFAADFDYNEIFWDLLSAGADANIPDDNGLTPANWEGRRFRR